MPSAKTATVAVTCPQCGHVQPEPRTAYSTVCKKCRSHFRLEESPRTARSVPRPAAKTAIDLRPVRCFDCGTDLLAPATAESTSCKRCGRHVDLRDYIIAQAVSKNFRTHGRLVIEEKGYLFNTDSVAGDAVIKGRLIGKIAAERTLELHSTADIKGSFTTARLVVPAGNHFRWKEALRVGAAEVGGELVANIHTMGTVLLRSTARLFGDIQAGDLIVESGAVFVGAARIGNPT